MADGRDFCAFFLINHISAQSKEFKDFEEKGSALRSTKRQRLLCYLSFYLSLGSCCFVAHNLCIAGG
jgi:hypothetical protein